MAKVVPPELESLNTISHNTNIKGDIDSAGDIRIDGTVKGNLKCKGRVVLGQKADVEGAIFCKTGDIMGRVNGTIAASESLSLKSSAIVDGDISMSKLSVEPGAVFTGKCLMGGREDNNRAVGTPPVKNKEK